MKDRSKAGARDGGDGRDRPDGDLRMAYEAAVRELALRKVMLETAGHDAEATARDLHARRRDLAVRYKALTPEPLRSQIMARTMAVYGNPLGPDIDMLRRAGKSWDEIAAAAITPGRFVHDGITAQFGPDAGPGKPAR